MDLDMLKVFVTVVDQGSFKAAAAELGTSRATIRRRIEELESLTDSALLERTRTGITATVAGKLLADRGRETMRESEELMETLRSMKYEPQGTLTILMPVGLPPHVSSLFFGQVTQMLPKIKLNLRFSQNPLDDIDDDTDLVAYFGEDLPRGSFICKTVLHIEEALVASPHYLRRRGTPTRVEDLHDHDLLSWEPPNGVAEVWPLVEGGTVTVSPTMVSSDMHLVRMAAADGMGIGRVLDMGAPEPVGMSQPVTRVLDGIVGARIPGRLVWPESRGDLPTLRKFLDTMLPMAAPLGQSR